MWCVATCTKTRRPMKVLLFSVLLPGLVMCLVRLPVAGEVYAAILTCNWDRLPGTVSSVMGYMGDFLALTEVTSIAATAVVR